MTDSLESMEDPLLDSLVVTVIAQPNEPLRIESNGMNENDVIATLVKAAMSVVLESLVADISDEDESE